MKKFEEYIINKNLIGIINNAQRTLWDVNTAVRILRRTGLNTKKLDPIASKLKSILTEINKIVNEAEKKKKIDWNKLKEFIDKYAGQIAQLKNEYQTIISDAREIVGFVSQIRGLISTTKRMINNAYSGYIKNLGKPIINDLNNLLNKIKNYVASNGVPKEIPKEWKNTLNNIKAKYNEFKAKYDLEMAILKEIRRCNSLLEEIENAKPVLSIHGYNNKVKALENLGEQITQIIDQLYELLKWSNLETVQSNYNALKSKINQISHEIEKYATEAKALNIIDELEGLIENLKSTANALRVNINTKINQINQLLNQAKNIANQIIATNKLNEKKSKLRTLESKAKTIKTKIREAEKYITEQKKKEAKTKAENAAKKIKSATMTKEEAKKIINQKFVAAKNEFKEKIRDLIAKVIPPKIWVVVGYVDNPAYQVAVAVADGIIDTLLGAAKAVVDWAMDNFATAAEILIKAIRYGWSFLKVVGGFIICKILEGIASLLSLLGKGIIWFIDTMGSLMGIPAEIRRIIKNYVNGVISKFVSIINGAIAYVQKWVEEGARVLGEAINAVIYSIMNTIKAGISFIMNQVLTVAKSISMIDLSVIMNTMLMILDMVMSLVGYVAQLMMIVNAIQATIEVATAGIGAVITRIVLPVVAAIILNYAIPAIVRSMTGIELSIAPITLDDILSIIIGGIQGLILWLIPRIIGICLLVYELNLFKNYSNELRELIDAMISGHANIFEVLALSMTYIIVDSFLDSIEENFGKEARTQAMKLIKQMPEDTGMTALTALSTDDASFQTMALNSSTFSCLNPTNNTDVNKDNETQAINTARALYTLYLELASCMLLILTLIDLARKSFIATKNAVYYYKKKYWKIKKTQWDTYDTRNKKYLYLIPLAMLGLGMLLEFAMETWIESQYGVSPSTYIQPVKKKYGIITSIAAALTVLDLLGEISQPTTASLTWMYGGLRRNTLASIIAEVYLERNLIPFLVNVLLIILGTVLSLYLKSMLSSSSSNNSDESAARILGIPIKLLLEYLSAMISFLAVSTSLGTLIHSASTSFEKMLKLYRKLKVANNLPNIQNSKRSLKKAANTIIEKDEESKMEINKNKIVRIICDIIVIIVFFARGGKDLVVQEAQIWTMVASILIGFIGDARDDDKAISLEDILTLILAGMLIIQGIRIVEEMFNAPTNQENQANNEQNRN